MVWDERIEETLRRHDDYFNGKSEGITEGYDSGKSDGITLGIKQGVQQGIEQKQTEMIINFYNNKVPIDVISKSSGLSIDKVKEIIKLDKK